MDNEQLLQAISDMMDKKLKPINDKMAKVNDRLDIIEFKQNRTSKKLDDLQLDLKIAERDIRRDIHTLNDEMETVIEILKMNHLIPVTSTDIL